MRRLRQRICDATLIASAAFAAAGLAGSLSIVLDFANNFTPVWSIAGGIAGLLGAISGGRHHRKARLAVAGVILLAGGYRIVPELMLRPAPAEAHGDAVVRIIQFNTWDQNARPRSAAAWLLRQKPDIIVAEEVGMRSPLRSLLARAYPHVTSCAAQGGPCSTLIFSRKPPIAVGGLAVGDPENRRAVSAAWATFSSPSGRFTVVGLHFGRPWPWRSVPGEEQAIVRFLDSVDRGSVIVAGDFNRTAWSAGMARLDRAFALRRVTRALPTWPARGGGIRLLPILPIDHIYVGPRWTVRDVRRGPELGSDHLPIMVTLAADSASAN